MPFIKAIRTASVPCFDEFTELPCLTLMKTGKDKLDDRPMVKILSVCRPAASPAPDSQTEPDKQVTF